MTTDIDEEKLFDNPAYDTSTKQLCQPEPNEYAMTVLPQQKNFPRVKYTMYNAVIQNLSSQKTTNTQHAYDTPDGGKANGNIRHACSD